MNRGDRLLGQWRRAETAEGEPIWVLPSATRTGHHRPSLGQQPETHERIARLTLPSRLELKRPEGSDSDAPFAKVVLTTLLSTLTFEHGASNTIAIVSDVLP